MVNTARLGPDPFEAPMPPWLRWLRVFWAVLLASAFAFSIVMAAWSDLRQALMAKVIADRHAKSFLIQAPAGAEVWVGDELLGAARRHELAEGEPPDSDLKVEGMSVLTPRVYMRATQLLKAAVRREPGEDAASLVGRLAPGAELLWKGETVDGFTPLLLLADGELDFVCLCEFEFPHGADGLIPSAFLLRARHAGSRVFSMRQARVWSDQIRVPGKFWTQRDEHDGLPPTLDGQVKTVWEWHIEVEPEFANWLRTHAPTRHNTPWRPLPTQ
jgi:hypothetical protein